VPDWKNIMSEVLLPTDNEIILRDCPWRFANWSIGELAKRGEKWGRANGRSPYDVVTSADLADMPLERIAAKDCVLLDWVTFPKLQEAIAVTTHRTDARGKPIWTYKTVAFVWVKTTSQAERNLLKMFDHDMMVPTPDKLWAWITGKRTKKEAGLWHFGSGYWTHGNVECCLIYTRGKGTSFRMAKDVSQLIISPVGEHSAKPQQQYALIDQLLGKVRPRIELFARKSNPPPAHWNATGLEFDGQDIFYALGGPRPVPDREHLIVSHEELVNG
jgi:N6-adenosine-specific RNA methylase IME4